jgi:hypothetical protein
VKVAKEEIRPADDLVLPVTVFLTPAIYHKISIVNQSDNLLCLI